MLVASERLVLLPHFPCTTCKFCLNPVSVFVQAGGGARLPAGCFSRLRAPGGRRCCKTVSRQRAAESGAAFSQDGAGHAGRPGPARRQRPGGRDGGPAAVRSCLHRKPHEANDKRCPGPARLSWTPTTHWRTGRGHWGQPGLAHKRGAHEALSSLLRSQRLRSEPIALPQVPGAAAADRRQAHGRRPRLRDGQHGGRAQSRSRCVGFLHIVRAA